MIIYNHLTGERATTQEIHSLHSTLDVHHEGSFLVADRKGWCQIHEGAKFECRECIASPYANLQAAVVHFGWDL